jgi:dUTP pyrophosphatase
MATVLPYPAPDVKSFFMGACMDPTVRFCFLAGAAAVYGAAPAYATPGSAGMDLRACLAEEEAVIPPGGRLAVPSGLAVEPVDDRPDRAWRPAGFVYSRSGLGAVRGLTVAQGVGVIDPDYRGEIVVILLNTSQESIRIRRGERVAQIVFQPVCRVRMEQAVALGRTERAAGGFGHTGP